MRNNEKKRTSSKSVDALTLSSNKFKLKGGQPSPQKITSTPSPKKPKLDGIATWLSGASKKELDDLLTWLKVRKKDTSAHAKEKWGTGLEQPARSLDGDRRSNYSTSGTTGQAPKISQSISLQKIFDPEDR